MKRFVLCVIFSVLIIGLSTLTEARGDGRHGGGGHGGGGHGGYSGGYHGGHHRGHHGGRYYWGPFVVGGVYSYYYAYPFWYGGIYYWPGYYSYPPSTIIIDSAPSSEPIPPTVSPPSSTPPTTPRRCQIWDGELLIWKDIPCR